MTRAEFHESPQYTSFSKIESKIIFCCLNNISPIFWKQSLELFLLFEQHFTNDCLNNISPVDV